MKFKKIKGGEIFISPISLSEKNPSPWIYGFLRTKLAKKYSVIKDSSILKKIRTKRNLEILVIIIISSLPLKTSAISQITNSINIDNAVRGRIYEEKLTIINPNDQNATIIFTAIGNISKWVKFYENHDSQQAIDELDFHPNSRKDIIAKITIPPFVQNGDYAGFFRVSSDTENSNNRGFMELPKEGIDREIKIRVTGEESVSFDAVVSADSYDISKGSPMKIKIIYKNKGEVEINPKISLRIKNDKNENVYNEEFPYPANAPKINPGASAEIPCIEIPTNNLKRGRYEVILRIFQGENRFIEKNFDFSVGEVKSANSIAGKFFTFLNITTPVAIITGILACLFIFAAARIKARKKAAVSALIPFHDETKKEVRKNIMQ